MSEYLPEAFTALARDVAGGFEDAGEAGANFFNDTADRAGAAADLVTSADQRIGENADAIGSSDDLPGITAGASAPGGKPRLNISDLDLETVSPKTAEFIRFAEQTYGDRFVIHEWTDNVSRNIGDLARIPRSVHVRVAQYLDAKGGSAGLYFGEGGVPELDDLGPLAGQTPRGWPEGATWDQVGAALMPPMGVLAVGTVAGGSPSAALHEYGHLIDDVYGSEGRASSGVDWNRFYSFVRKAEPAPGTIKPYFLQPGKAGREEMFAEAFARYHMADPAKQLTRLTGSASGGRAFQWYFQRLLGY
jgi:hypothetical protein